MGNSADRWEDGRTAMMTQDSEIRPDRRTGASGTALDECTAGATAIVEADLWCVIEIWVSATRRWEPRLLICRTDVDQVRAAVTRWVAKVPDFNARLAGYTRDRLRRVESVPTALCHIGGLPPGGAA